MSQTTTQTNDSRPDDQTFVSINRTAKNENYTENDNRHGQEYWGSLILNFPVMIDDRALPEYAKKEGRWARGIWSKFPYMLGWIGTTAQAIARLKMAGIADPSEVTLGEDGEKLDYPGEIPDWFDISDEGNPLTGEPIRPFDELEALLLRVDISYSRMPDPSAENDFHDFYIKTEIRAEVERPSMIPSKTELRGVQSRLHKKTFMPMNAAFARAFQLARRRVQVKKHIHVATNVASNWAKHFTSEAKEETNFKERLDALYDEVRENAHDRAEEFFESYTDEEIAEELEMPLAAVQTCKRVWENYLNIGSGLPPAKSNVSAEEVMKDLPE